MGVDVGAVLGGAVGAVSSAGQAAINWKIAKEQMRFQERMSNTAHQREVRDLVAAGVNPLLTGKYGGASTPPGAMWSMPDIGASALAGARSGAERQRVEADTRVAAVSAKHLDQQITESKARTLREGAQEASAWAQSQLDQIQSTKLLQEIPTAAFHAQTAAQQARQEKIRADVMELGVKAAARAAEFEGGDFFNVMRYVNQIPGINLLVPGAAIGTAGRVSGMLQAPAVEPHPGPSKPMPGPVLRKR